jgi:hypothetical protein
MADFNDLGGVSILGFISPFNTGDTYPVIDPLYGIDGFRNVNTISELNSIPNARRRAGMFVGVSGGTEYYKLNTSPWSGDLSDWTLIDLNNIPITGFTYNGNNNTFTLTDGYSVSLDAYLDSVSGLTSTGVISSGVLSATTYLNLPLDIFVTGGTYNNNLGRATFVNNTGGTFNVDGFFTGQTDTILSAFTYNNANTLTVSDTSGNAFSSTVDTMTGLTVTGTISAATISGGTFFGDGSNLSGISTQDLYITGMTFNPSNYDLSIGRNDSAIFTQNLAILSSDINITGGTYNSNTGVATFTNNTGGTFNVTGFLTGFTDIYTTGSTYDNSTKIITFTRNDGNSYNVNISGGSSVDTFVTGFTYSSDTLTIFQNENQPPLSATLPTTTLESIFSAATFNFNTTGSISATSVSATTYLNLPLDIRVTGGTYNNITGGATFVNNTGGTFNVTGFTTGSTDTFVTGFTYSNNTLTLSRNQDLPNLSTNINSFTGLTINGNLNVTGNTVMSAVTASTISNVDYIDFTTTFTGSIPSARVAWSADYGTLVLGLNGGATSNLVGQETLYYVKNQTTPGPGFTINRGQVAAAIGTVGSGASGRILAGLGIANGSIPDITIMGIATENIVNGDDGYVTAFGNVRDINTTGSLYGESWSAGTILYVSHTVAGGLTKFEPPSPNLKIPIAIVIHANASNGILFVRPTFRSKLNDLYDVQVSGQTNGDLLVYNSGTTTWGFTKTMNGNYDINGSLSGTSFNSNSVNTNTLIVSSNSQLDGQISSTNLSGSTDRLLQVSSGGTFTATTQVISAYITSGATVANLLDDTNNWDINGNYTGTTITNTFQGQKHYNPSYFFEAVNDNLWIRLIRG